MEQSDKLKLALNYRNEGLSLRAIASLLEVSPSTVSRWLSGKVDPAYNPRSPREWTEEQKAKMREGSAKGRRNRVYLRKPREALKSFTHIRASIFNERGRKCEQCGWAETNPHTGHVPVQIHYIDGNKKNNTDANLMVLCPNCHSLTSNFMFYGQSHK